MWLVCSYFDPEECLYMSTRENRADETRWLRRNNSSNDNNTNNNRISVAPHVGLTSLSSLFSVCLEQDCIWLEESVKLRVSSRYGWPLSNTIKYFNQQLVVSAFVSVFGLRKTPTCLFLFVRYSPDRKILRVAAQLPDAWVRKRAVIGFWQIYNIAAGHLWWSLWEVQR